MVKTVDFDSTVPSSSLGGPARHYDDNRAYVRPLASCLIASIRPKWVGCRIRRVQHLKIGLWARGKPLGVLPHYQGSR